MKTYYIHTIDGKPGVFYGRQICFMNFYGKANPLAESLEQIKVEQRKTILFRKEKGFKYDPKRYGYFRVSVPE